MKIFRVFSIFSVVSIVQTHDFFQCKFTILCLPKPCIKAVHDIWRVIPRYKSNLFKQTYFLHLVSCKPLLKLALGWYKLVIMNSYFSLMFLWIWEKENMTCNVLLTWMTDKSHIINTHSCKIIKSLYFWWSYDITFIYQEYNNEICV